jgi:pyruvate/2-oxoglutarate dehydrogenase complex dihydrolipoamide dehydrogenase (E3) component
MSEYDVIVVGAGMAGLNATATAQAAGARVALVERTDRVGGTCPIRGCIPSKAMIRSAEIAHDARHASEYGVHTGDVSVDFGEVMTRVRGIVEKGSRGARGWVESLDGVDLIFGQGTLADPTTVLVDGRELVAPKVLLTTGAEPGRVPIPGLDRTPYITSDDVLLDLTELPGDVLIIGAGPIGLEFGQAFTRFGANVTIVEKLPRLLPGGDPDLAGELAEHLTAEGITLLTGADIRRAETSEDGRPSLIVDRDGREQTLTGDALLLSVGRGPAVEGLGLDAAGVDHSARGVVVDERLQTSVAGVWAAGDILTGEWGAFTHVARRLGKEMVQNALGLDPHNVDADSGPRAIFTDPEMASIGLSAAEAEEQGYDVVVGRSGFSGGKARAWGQEKGTAVIVGEKGTGRILGAEILGYHAADLLHPVVVAMQVPGAPASLVADTFHIHPTLGEVVQGAAAQIL